MAKTKHFNRERRMLDCWWVVCLCLLWLIAYGRATAASSSRPLLTPFNSEYLVDSFGVEEGFPGNACTGIGQTPEGYLWFSSFSGLARFDSQQFSIYNSENLPALSDARVLNLHVDRQGRLLFGTMTGVLIKSARTWTNLNLRLGERELVRGFAEGPKGELFLATHHGRIFQIIGESAQELPSPPGEGGAYLGVDANGQPWVVRNGFNGNWNGRRWTEFAGLKNPSSGLVGCGTARQGGVWLVLTNQAVLIRDGKAVREIPLTDSPESFWTLHEDSRGQLWLPNISSGVQRISPDGTVRRFSKADGLPNDTGVRAVFEDADGSIWIGCGVGGVVRFRPERFHSLNASAGLPDAAVTSIGTSPSGLVWVGTYGGGVLKLDNSRLTNCNKITARFIQSLLVTRAGEIFVSTASEGTFWVQGDRVINFKAANPKFPETITALFEDRQGRVWAGSPKSVGYFTNGTYRPLLLATNWRQDSVFFAQNQTNQDIWIGNRNSIYKAYPAQNTLIRVLTLPENTRVTSLVGDQDGRMWIGTARDGLLGFSNGRLARIPPAAGLPGTSVFGLVEDLEKQLWFGSGRTLVCASSAELWEAATRTNRSLSLRTYSQRDGLGTPDFLDGFQPVSHRDALGQIWFGLLRGVAMTTPQKTPEPRNPPKLVLESLEFFPAENRRPVKLDLSTLEAPPVLPQDSTQIRVTSALLDYAATERRRFRFQLDSHAGVWQDNGSSPIISLYQVPPGRRTLIVQAANENGIWSVPAQLNFEVEELFWRSTSFWIIAGIILALVTGAGTWWLTSLRVRQTRLLLEQKQKLAALQARLGLVLENTSDLVAFADAHGNIFYLNQAGRRLIGLAPEEPLSGLDLKHLYPAWVQNLQDHLWLPAFGQQSIWSGESALIHRDGHELPVSQVVIAHRHPDGSLDFSSTICRDISAAKKNERVREALRSLASALTAALKPDELGRTIARECHRLFEHDAFFFVRIDENGNILPGQYFEDTETGKNFPEPVTSHQVIIGPNLKEVLTGKNLLLNRQTETDLAEAIGKNEQFGDIQRVSASRMFAPISWEGRTIGALSVQSYTHLRYGPEEMALLRSFADQCGPVVARLMVEEKFRQNEERLRLALEAARSGSWEILPQAARLIASEQSEALYHFAPGTMSGPISRLTEHIPANEAALVQGELQSLLSGRTPSIECIHRWQPPGRPEQWLELKARQHHQSDGKNFRIIGITADITERRLAELDRERLEKQLRQAQKLDALGRLAGGIAHDFNNILTSIIGYNDLATNELAPGHPATPLLQEVNHGAQRAKQLVAQILAFSSQREQQKTNFRLGPVINEALKLLRSSLPANIEIRQANETNEADFILGDATQIHQVIMNLGTNAGHAMQERGGVLEIRLESLQLEEPWQNHTRRMPPGKYLRLTVSDNGRGMTPEVLERIFEPFFSTKNPKEGTGLGLSVVHGILKSHDAKIQVQSEPGKGTTFEIVFPTAPPASPTSRATTQTPDGTGQHVLVVDDEERIARLASRILQRSGYRVTAFENPAAALAAFQAEPEAFDLLLTDMTMPGMSGVELARAIHAVNAHLPVVLSTGYAGSYGPQNLQAEGIHWQLGKPYQAEELARIVAQALRKNGGR